MKNEDVRIEMRVRTSSSFTELFDAVALFDPTPGYVVLRRKPDSEAVVIKAVDGFGGDVWRLRHGMDSFSDTVYTSSEFEPI